MATLDHDTVRSALEGLEGWQLEDDAIVREWRHESFGAAIAFINRVAAIAEESITTPTSGTPTPRSASV
jgi:pterin-4a-carbinolamine dehydratase